MGSRPDLGVMWGYAPMGPFQGRFGAGGGAEESTVGDGEGAGRNPASSPLYSVKAGERNGTGET